MAAYPKKAKVPVSRHPAFPVVVALWCAAVLSLGSLALQTTALERLVLASHIDLVIPAAAPPLGFTFRIALAAGLFGFGALAGFLLGRAIARSGQPAERSHRFAEVRQPAPVYADDNEDLQRLDSARQAPIAGRRRALAMSEDVSLPYHDEVPTPGILDLSVLDEIAERVSGPDPLVAEIEHEPEPEEVYDDYEDAEVEEPVAEEVTVEEPAVEEPVHALRAFDAPVEAPVIEAIAEVVGQPLPGARPFAPPASPPAGLGLIPRDAADKLRTAPIGTLGVVELAERLAMAIARRKGDVAAPVLQPSFAAPEPVAPEPVVPEPVAQVVEPEPQLEAEPAPTPQPSVQIFDRLMGAAGIPASEPVDDAMPAEAAEPVAEVAAEPAPMALPAAMRPLRFDDLDEEPEELAVPPRRFAMPLQAAPANDVPVAAEPAPSQPTAETDDGYGSLLEMKAPQRPAFVRIEDPEDEAVEIEPVVIFPGHAAAESPAFAAPRRFDAPPLPAGAPRVPTGQARPVDAEETERALKAALATLQRMSGAA